MRFRIGWRTDPEISRVFGERIRERIKRFLHNSGWRTALDLGGGTGGRTFKYADETHVVVCLDISEEEIKRGREQYGRIRNFHLVIGDASAMPFGDNSFDVVICSATLHHIPNRVKALDEAHRLLRPHGRILFLEPGILNPLACVGRKFFPTVRHDPREKPFVPSELKKLVSRKFINVKMEHSGLLMYPMQFMLPYLGELSRAMTKILPYLIRIDDGLTHALKQFAGQVIITAEKPKGNLKLKFNE